MDIERISFWEEINPETELKAAGLFNTKWIGSKEDFNKMAIAQVEKFNKVQKEGKLKDFRALVLGTIGGKDYFEVRFEKAIEGESLEQMLARLGFKPKEN